MKEECQDIGQSHYSTKHPLSCQRVHVNEEFGEQFGRILLYLPAASSQVLQGSGRSLEGVGIGAFGQQGEVGLDNGGVPEHLNSFGGIHRVWKGANTVPLEKRRTRKKKKKERKHT